MLKQFYLRYCSVRDTWSDRCHASVSAENVIFTAVRGSLGALMNSTIQVITDTSICDLIRQMVHSVNNQPDYYYRS